MELERIMQDQRSAIKQDMRCLADDAASKYESVSFLRNDSISSSNDSLAKIHGQIIEKRVGLKVALNID